MNGHPLLGALGMLGDDAPSAPMVWSEIQPAGSDYAVQQGQRYAALASVSKNYTLAQVQSYLDGHGWQVTYGWEQGTATRGQFAIDQWLAALAPDTTSNHRWLYAEANRTGANATLGVDAPWPLTIYHVAHVFQAVPAPAGFGAAAATADELELGAELEDGPLRRRRRDRAQPRPCRAARATLDLRSSHGRRAPAPRDVRSVADWDLGR